MVAKTYSRHKHGCQGQKVAVGNALRGVPWIRSPLALTFPLKLRFGKPRNGFGPPRPGASRGEGPGVRGPLAAPKFDPSPGHRNNRFPGYDGTMTETLTEIALYTAFVLVLGIGWLLTLFSLPGNWLIVAAAAGYAWLVPDGSRWDLSWPLVGVTAALAVVGEVIEGAASAMGVRRLGGSRRGAFLSVIFSFIGAIVGTGAIPIPVVGTLLGACLGAMAGAVVGETWKGTDPTATDAIGKAAFWGRLWGALAKMVVACAMVAVAAIGALWH